MVQCLQLNRSWLGKPQPIFSAENVGEVTQICLWNRGALFPWTCQCHRRSIKTLHQVLTIRLKHRNKDGHFSVSQYFHNCWRGNTQGNTNSENLTALCLGFFCLFGWLVLVFFLDKERKVREAAINLTPPLKRWFTYLVQKWDSGAGAKFGRNNTHPSFSSNSACKEKTFECS